MTNWWDAAPVVGSGNPAAADIGGAKQRLDWDPRGDAYELPNGSIVRYGPRGGLTVLQGATTTGENGAPMRLTEDQGKSQGYARLMADAERGYAEARRMGYNPASIRNGVAAIFEGLPFGGLDGVGALIRDEAGDRGRQAELQWSDAQLKAMSGAAAPEKEVKRNVHYSFPRPGEDVADIGPRKRRARETAFKAAKVRAGPGAADVRYPEPAFRSNGDKRARSKPDKTSLGAWRRLASSGVITGRGEFGSKSNPYRATTWDVFNKLPKGSYYIDPEGNYGIID